MNRYNIPPNAFSHSTGMNKAKLGLLFNGRLHPIRHAAVHRNSTTISTLKEMLEDSMLLTKALRDEPGTEKLGAMQLALEENDTKWMEQMIATPISAFTHEFDPYKFRTIPGSFGNDLLQEENNQLENCRSMVQQPTANPPTEAGYHPPDRGKYAIEDSSGLGASSRTLIQSAKRQANIGQSPSTSEQYLRLSVTNSSVHGRDRRVQRGSRDSKSRRRGLKKKRSESTKFQRANQQAGDQASWRFY
jgi:hypothetical protein